MGLQLCKFDEIFLEKSYYWLNDPEIQALMNINKSITRESQREWFQGLESRTDYKIWGVKYYDIPIGAAGFRNISDISGEITMYIGDKQYWGGLGKPLLLLLEHKAKDMAFKVLYAKVLKENVRSFKSFQSSGYELIGSDAKFNYIQKYI